MSSFVPRPLPGYDPVLRLNLRQDPEGGPVLAQVQATWKGKQPLAQRELLVLVHGYNNHVQEAQEAYLGMRKRQEAQLSGSVRRGQLENRLGDVFWPGDADWPGVVDKLDFLFYADAVSVAREVAPRLSRYLRNRSDVLKVHFLAHSLGARVTLEVLDDLARNGGPPVGKVCLLAAAVPTFKVFPGGDLHGALAMAESLLVLFSPDDKVLSAGFPPGQTLAAGNEGFFPAAVGLAGDIPLTPGKVDRHQIRNAGHGDYWGHQSGFPSELSAKAIFEFFQFDSGRRNLAARSMPQGRQPPQRLMAARAVSSAP